MAAPKRPTHVTNGDNLYFKVDGKLQKLPTGTPLVLSKEKGEALAKRGMVTAMKDVKAVEVE